MSLSGASLAGVDAANYTLDYVQSTTANVDPLGITGSFTADNKIYDATTAATVLSTGPVPLATGWTTDRSSCS